MNDFDKAMVEILGNDAYFSTDFKVTRNVQRLSKAVNYLNGQLTQCKNLMQESDRDYVDDVKRIVVEIIRGDHE